MANEVPKNFKELETVVTKLQGKLQRYHVGIPYYYHFYVDATSEEEAIQKAHDSEGSMGEYDEANIFVEELPTRYLNEGDFYISDHIEDIKEHLEANPKYDSVAEVVSHLDIDLPGFPGDEIFEKAEAQIAAEIKKIKGD